MIFVHGREKSEEVIFLDNEKCWTEDEKCIDLFEKTRRQTKRK
jgi:hypothetical protein